ncbi:uncharacterized protein LOC135071299 [Ostrinia nubilalis]|uniref:uncharacterized protein LOC135071299 n=1 Tax=Ostrinia nubilalis TaxID=29057 RepID=UPI0030825A52
MAARIFTLAALCAAVSAAPPAPPRLYSQHAPAQLQQISPLDYYLDNPEVANYYNQGQQKQASSNAGPGAPSRLETLEPDSEVELIPGAQQPQQPPQQTPVSPNIPGLVPGQRVFIVHMPVPGYRPGTIGGYQPVYIVAAAPQGNVQYPGSAQFPGNVNGYQNAVLLDPSGQAVSPLLGYPRFGVQQHPGFLVAPQQQQFAYQPEHPGQYQQAPQAPSGARPVQLSQLIALQTHPANTANNPRAASNESQQNAEPKRLAQLRESNEKEADNRRSSESRDKQ